MVIDGHVHYGLGDGFVGPWDTRADIGRYAQRAAAAGIQRSVLLAAFTSDYASANRAVAARVRTAPQRWIGFAMVHAERDRTRIEPMIAEAVRLGLRGIKVHRHDARLNRQVCEAALAYRLPILYDPAGELATVDLAAGEYPGVPIIVPHLGSFADDWHAQRDCIDVMQRHRNVFADTSGVRRFDLLEEAIARVGHDRIIFGSDGPFLHPGVELEKIRLLRLAEAPFKAVCGGNLNRLLSRSGREAIRRAHGAAPRAPSSAPRTAFV